LKKVELKWSETNKKREGVNLNASLTLNAREGKYLDKRRRGGGGVVGGGGCGGGGWGGVGGGWGGWVFCEEWVLFGGGGGGGWGGGFGGGY